MSKLEEAIIFATRAHQGQTHATGTPYILHPLRVMNRIWAAGGSEEQMIIAVLHDVIEDTDVTPAELLGVFGNRIACGVLTLSRSKNVEYGPYICSIANSKWAALVIPIKLADLAENLELGRTHPLPEPRQSKLTKRYMCAQDYLRGKL